MLQLRGIVDLTGAEIRVIHEMHPVNCEVFHLKMVYDKSFHNMHGTGDISWTNLVSKFKNPYPLLCF